MEAAGEVSDRVVSLCCGWKATVQRSYPRRRSGVFRVIQVILLGSMITFLKRAPETSGHVTLLLAVTCLVLVTVVFIYLAHLLPLHHRQHCPPGRPRLRCCYRLSSILETLHDGVSSLVLLPVAILLLLLPSPSPPTAAAAVLTIVLVLLLAVQCAENLLKALQPTQPPHEDQGEEMRQVEQTTPSQGSRAHPNRRYTPNKSRGRGSARRWSKNKNPSSPLLPLSPISMSYSGSPVLTGPRSSIHPSSRHLSSLKSSSPPLPSSHTPLPYPGSPVSSYQEHSPPLSPHGGFVPLSSIFSSPPPFPSTSVPLPANASITAVPNPNSPVLSSPRTSPHLSSYSGIPLSSLSSSPPPLSHISVPQSPHASNVNASSILLSRPRTSSRIPHQSVVSLSSYSSPPPLPHISVAPLPHDPISPHLSPQKDVPLSQIQDVVLNNESWHSDPPSPIYTCSQCPSPIYPPSTGPSPPHTHTLGSSPPPSYTNPSLTNETPIYANINNPCDTTFNVSPNTSDHLTVSDLDPTRPTTSAIYVTPWDASADNGIMYENLSPLTISTTTTIAVTTSTSISSGHSPVYAAVLSDTNVTTTTTANTCHNPSNSITSPDHRYTPVSYL